MNAAPISSPNIAPKSGGGVVLGRYRVIAKLGQGGMSEVLLAAVQGARGVNKLNVIKRLRSDLHLVDRPSFDQLEPLDAALPFASMFLEEAKITCQLNHPSIVHTYEVGEEAGQLCIVMEYIEGESLHAVHRRLVKNRGTMPPALAARVMSEALAGLHYAHEMRGYDGQPLNLVHRDVSPQNIMLSYQGQVKLLDFGIAKTSASEVQTEVGMLKGKVHYMAPEQAQGRGVDRRADVFAAGIVLWELLTLRRLVQGDSPISSWFSLLNDPFLPPSTFVDGVDPRLDAIVMRALDRDPTARFPTALAMREALEEYLAASGEVVTLEQVGRFVSDLFETTRLTRAQQIREFLAAYETYRAEGGPAPPSVIPDSLSAEGSPLPTLPTIMSGTPGATPVGRRKQRGAGLLFIGAAAIAGGFYVYGRGGLHSVAGWGGGTGVSAVVPPAGQALTPPAPATPDVAPAASAERFAAAPPAAPEAKPDATAAPSKSEKSEGTRKLAVAPPPPAPRPAPRPAALPPKPAETPSSTEEPAGNGFLTLDTYPWTRVTENGRVIGTTPLVRVPLAPGVHTLTLENAGENVKKSTTVTIKSGENVSRRLAFQ